MHVDQVLSHQPAAAGVRHLGPGGLPVRPRGHVPAGDRVPGVAVVGRRRHPEPLVLRGPLRDGRRRAVPRGRDGRRGGRGCRSRGHELAHRRRGLRGEPLDGRGVVGRQDERVDAVLGDEARQSRSGVWSGPTFSRRRIAAGVAAGRASGAVDASRCPPRGRRAGGTAGSAASRRPCGPSGEHPRLVRADPDPHVVGGRGPRLRAVHAVVLARRARAAARVGVPERADDVDRLLQRVDALRPACRRRPPIASIASQNPPAPSPSSARPPLRQVERRHRPRQHRGRPERQVQHVGGERDAARCGRRRRTAASRCRGTAAGTGGPGR